MPFVLIGNDTYVDTFSIERFEVMNDVFPGRSIVRIYFRSNNSIIRWCKNQEECDNIVRLLLNNK